MSEPKVFISYSWSTPTHERWVLDLAEELIGSGINVILDKWDLKPGQDSIDFMEQMVKDPSIDKVLIISDKVYAEKADNRSGGVGTETQIISKKIYDQVDQERFIAVIAEKDLDGKAYIPLFYHSRLYIDLSEPDRYADGFDSLIRCIHGQPQFKKPALGKKPEYLNSEASINLGTSALFKRAIAAIREQKPFAAAALDEYLVTFSDNLEQIRISASPEEMFDDCVVSSIQLFIPVRNELLQIMDTSCRYLPQQEFAEVTHKFLESLTKYFTEINGRSSYRSSDFDNYKFIIGEIFLYIVTILIKHNKFQAAAELLNSNYYIQSSNKGVPHLTSCQCFYENPESLDYRNNRLNLNRSSISADLTKENNSGTGVDFHLLMQTDFILFVRNSLDKSGFWWPKTLVYLGHFPGAFEIFSRAASQQYFEKIKPLLKISSKTELIPLIAEHKQQGARYYGFGHSFDIKRLLNFDDLCTIF
ncbi:toll/interleukin-1 receptor domain-containing protein [Pseudomonas koreensis]|uniref:toll/interleukin-1 receptor domain-containing protein n=1 Tax=Pseudomonas koreensis TaxID=198620 RepID=UPI0030187758